MSTLADNNEEALARTRLIVFLVIQILMIDELVALSSYKPIEDNGSSSMWLCLCGSSLSRPMISIIIILCTTYIISYGQRRDAPF